MNNVFKIINYTLLTALLVFSALSVVEVELARKEVATLKNHGHAR